MNKCVQCGKPTGIFTICKKCARFYFDQFTWTDNARYAMGKRDFSDIKLIALQLYFNCKWDISYLESAE